MCQAETERDDLEEDYVALGPQVSCPEVARERYESSGISRVYLHKVHNGRAIGLPSTNNFVVLYTHYYNIKRASVSVSVSA